MNARFVVLVGGVFVATGCNSILKIEDHPTRADGGSAGAAEGGDAGDGGASDAGGSSAKSTKGGTTAKGGRSSKGGTTGKGGASAATGGTTNSVGGTTNSVGGTTNNVGGTTAAGGTTVTRNCDPSKPFGAPMLVVNVPQGIPVMGIATSSDGLSAMVGVNSATFSYSIKTTTRPSLDVAFAAPATDAAVSAWDTADHERVPVVSRDGLTAFFSRAFDYYQRIYVSTRSSAMEPFGTPVELTGPNINTSAANAPGRISVDKTTFYWVANLAVYEGVLSGSTITSSGKMLVTSGQQQSLTVLDDGLSAYISHSTGGAYQIWKATRIAVGSPWSTPSLVTELAGADRLPYDASPDGCILYFGQNDQLYQARKPL